MTHLTVWRCISPYLLEFPRASLAFQTCLAVRPDRWVRPGLVAACLLTALLLAPIDRAASCERVHVELCSTSQGQLATTLIAQAGGAPITSSPAVTGHGDVAPGYVYQIDGNFHVDATPIRFWGVNMGWGGSWKQGGDTHRALDHADLDRFVGRLKALGFNAVRIFPPSSFMFGNLQTGKDTDYAKNDGSLVEKFDYFLYRLKQEGMYVYMSLNLFGPRSRETNAMFQGPTAEFDEWKAASKAYGWPYVIDQAFLVDETWQQIKIRNALRVLRHFNKWTGKHYYEDEVFALYELNNEVRFPARILGGELDKPVTGDKRGGMPPYFERQYQAQWNEYLRGKYSDDSGLPEGYLRSGESLSDSSVALAPAAGQAGYLAVRAQDFAQFVLDHYLAVYGRLVDAIRATAPRGVGANVAPINLDSISGEGDSIVTGFAMARGGFNAGNDYEHHHYTLLNDAQHPYFPYVSMLSLPPAPYGYPAEAFHQTRMNMQVGRTQGQPFVMYEGMTMTPNIFKAEYPIIQAVFGSWQDHGGYFFYQYPIRSQAEDPMWYRGPLLYAKDNQWASTPGFARDEVMLSATWAVGAAFRNFGIEPAPSPTVFTFGRDAIYAPDWRSDAETTEAARRVARTAFKYGAELAFEPEGPFAGRVEGPVQEGDFAGPVETGNGEIRWDWPEGRLIVDTPFVKIYAGVFPPDRRLEFRDGVTVENLNRPWGFFILASDTNEPIARAERVFLSLVQTSDNTGFEIDPSLLSRDPRTVTGWRRAILNEGTLPVLVQRMGADVTLPELPGRVLLKRDFDLQQIGPLEDASHGIRVSADEPVFQWILLSGDAAQLP